MAISNREEIDPVVGELQLRTVCQNAWSMLSHILSYKPDTIVPNEINREVNALSALMEIADNQFERILNLVNKLPVSNPNRILNALNSFFYSNIAAWYDSELSHYFLDDISNLYRPEEDIIHLLEAFINEKGDDITKIASMNQHILFFSQPEIVIILERLENQKFLLEEYWKNKFPIDQLEEIAIAWGTSIE